MTCFEQLANCADERELTDSASAFAAQLGFDHWALAMRLPGPARSAQAVWTLSNLPSQLHHARIECFVGLSDASGLDWMRNGVPYAWHTAAPPQGTLRGMECVERFRTIALQHGVQGGLCVPVPGTGGAAGSLTLATCRPSGDLALNALQALALLFSRYLHLACLPLIEAEQERRAPRLSGRETECLSWAAMGKTTWEISRVLDISEHTVIYHLRNAGGKLGAVNRQQAIAMAIQLGVLSASGQIAGRKRPPAAPVPAQRGAYMG